MPPSKGGGIPSAMKKRASHVQGPRTAAIQQHDRGPRHARPDVRNLARSRVRTAGHGDGGDYRRRFDAARLRDWSTAVIVASGPSAAEARFDLVRGFPVIAVNDAWRLVPGADLLYAADAAWWRVHHDAVRKAGFAGQCWTAEASAEQAFGIHRVEGELRSGLCHQYGRVYYNLNSGAQAMQMAWHWGARRLVLIGMDMGPVGGQSHFFGDHPKQCRKDFNVNAVSAATNRLVAELMREGVDVINTSPTKRLVCRNMTLEAALASVRSDSPAAAVPA